MARHLLIAALLAGLLTGCGAYDEEYLDRPEYRRPTVAATPAAPGGTPASDPPAAAALPGGDSGAPAPDVEVGSSRVDLQACKLEYSIVSPK